MGVAQWAGRAGWVRASWGGVGWGHSEAAAPGMLQLPLPGALAPILAAWGQRTRQGMGTHGVWWHLGRSLWPRRVLAALINLDSLLMNLRTVLGWIGCHSG